MNNITKTSAEWAQESDFEISTYQTDIEFGVKSVIAQLQNVLNEF